MRRLVTILLLTCSVIVVTAKDIDVSARLDTNQILIGDWINLTLEVSRSGTTLLEWPEIMGAVMTADTTELEVIDATPIDTQRLEDNFIRESRKLTLTVFDSGYYVIPPFQFRYKPEGHDTFEIAETEPLLLTVLTVKVDTSMPIKPIKDPLDMPFQISEIKYWLIGGGVLLVLLGILFWFLKNRKKRPQLIKKVIRKDPSHVIALEKLKKLEAEKQWQKGEVKLYYSELSEIIREYIEGRYEVQALEYTTSEIMAGLTTKSINQSLREKLESMLRESDLVKFAKYDPLPDQHSKYLQQAYDFVNLTKTEEQSQNVVVEEQA